MFEVLGLSSDEGQLYAVLIESPRATVAELADYSSLLPHQANRTLRWLTRRGLATRLPGKQARYTAVAPDLAIEPLISQQEAHLRQARAVSHELMKTFHEASRQEHPAELVEIITGADNILRRFAQLQDTARVQIRSFDKPPYVGPAGVNPREERRLKEGLIYRIIYTAEVVRSPGRLIGDIRATSELGEQARVRPDLPLKIVISDDRQALIPIKTTRAGSTASFVVHPCDLLDALMALFESEWQRAIPLRSWTEGDSTIRDDRPDEASRDLLACMAAGLTDETIARALGCSLRTAQRHIRRLMQELNASSRFQAGMEARGRGWV